MVKWAVVAVWASTSSWKRTTVLSSKPALSPGGVTMAGMLLLLMVPTTFWVRSSVTYGAAPPGPTVRPGMKPVATAVSVTLVHRSAYVL